MAVECPVCREPIPWHRLFFTTAWGSWRCSACDSRLAVNVWRRLIFVAVTMVVLYSVTRVVRLGPAWDLPLVLLTVAVVMVPCFMFFERARVLERRGFRCRQCGYDLKGQVEARCPECGLAFDEEEADRLKRVAQRTAEATVRRTRFAWVVVALVVVGFLTTLLGLGLTLYMKGAGGDAAPEIKVVVRALLAFSDAHDGRPPDHALRLILDGRATAEDFVTFSTLTAADAIRIADTTLAQVGSLSAERKRETAQAAADALPTGTIAHRLGDFVFTYHGIDFGTADPSLWVVIWSPDPAQNPGLQAEDLISIGLAGGQVIRVSAIDFADRLRAQNELRTLHGLPPLTNPFAVTNGKPMIAPP